MSGVNWKLFVFGGLASIIDLTKTRLQVQGQSNDVQTKHRRMFHPLFLVKHPKEEGVLALYSGTAPALLRQIYQSLKQLFVEHLEDETLLINMICGVVSGVISSTIVNLTYVLKILILFQGSMIGSFIGTGVCGGVWFQLAQHAAVIVGVELPVYDITKKHLIFFTCGLAEALASNLVDVVCTCMMNQRAIMGHVDLYKGTSDVILKMWKHEGFFALYKEFWPNWLWLGPWNIIFLITYKQLKRLQI
uniref:Uncharacterized protein n=1 Tax=Aotus nancymaae TaxID=37293 RepID=A0A2K5F162_AOTNA